MKSRIVIALALAGTLAGCGIFKGSGGRPKTAVLGERIPVLTADNDAEIDPALAGQAVTAPEPVANPAWPQPGGNAEKSMGNPALGASLSRAWTAHIAKSSPQKRYAAGPVVADGRVYVMDSDAVVHAFSLDNGGRIWETQIAALGKGKLAKDRTALFGGGVSYDDGKIYATDGLGDVAALDGGGKVLWRKRPGGPLRGAPTVANGIVYAVSQDNQIFALKTDSGDTLWSQSGTLQASGVFGVAAPAVSRGTVVAGFSSGELVAMRYENGHGVWSDQLSRTSISTAVASISDIDASPVIDNGRVFSIGQGGRMVAIDLFGGQRLWELSIAGIDTPSVAGQWVFVVTDMAKVFCIQRDTGKVRWMASLPRWKNEKKHSGDIFWSGPVMAGGRLLLASNRGDLDEIAIADGKIGRQIKKAGKAFTQSPVVAGNTMLLLDEKGNLTAWR